MTATTQRRHYPRTIVTATAAIALAITAWAPPAHADTGNDVRDLINAVTGESADVAVADRPVSGAVAGIEALSPGGETVSIDVVNERVAAAGTSTFGDATLTALTTADGHGYVASMAVESPSAIYIVLESPKSQTRHEFNVSVDGQPARLVLSEDGLVEVQGASGETVNIISPAWARDAAGTPVQTSYSVSGSTLVQEVTLTGAEQFPVVADPALACSGIFCTVEFNRAETQNIGYFAPIGATAAVACSYVPHLFAAAVCAAYIIGMAGWITGTAQQAYGQGDCLGIRFVPGSLASTHPAVHHTGNCW